MQQQPAYKICPTCQQTAALSVPICQRCGYVYKLDSAFEAGARQKYPRGIDKGFCLVYFSLSYRRKLIRTLWMMPFAFVLLFLDIPYPVLWFVGSLVLSIIQAAYNFYQWKTLEQQPGQDLFR
jgi:hypothetical protein